MKHKTFYIFIIVIAITLLFTFNCFNHDDKLSGEMDAVSCRTTTFDNGSMEDITVILNQSEVPDYQLCAEEIIHHVLNNDFHTILFNFEESGYPVELSASVYLNEDDRKNGKSLFRMKYSQDSSYHYLYNIYDNPEKFTILIIK